MEIPIDISQISQFFRLPQDWFVWPQVIINLLPYPFLAMFFYLLFKERGVSNIIAVGISPILALLMLPLGKIGLIIAIGGIVYLKKNSIALSWGAIFLTLLILPVLEIIILKQTSPITNIITLLIISAWIWFAVFKGLLWARSSIVRIIMWFIILFVSFYVLMIVLGYVNILQEKLPSLPFI